MITLLVGGMVFLIDIEAMETRIATAVRQYAVIMTQISVHRSLDY